MLYRPDMHLFSENLVLVVSRAKITRLLIAYFSICAVISAVGYIEAMYMAAIMTGDDVFRCLFIIGAINMMSPVFRFANEVIYKKYIMERLNETAYRHYWSLPLSAHPMWLEENENINTSIEKGIESIKGTFRELAGIARPLFKIVSSLAFLISVTASSAACLFGVVIIVSVGYWLSYNNHLERKKIKKKHKDNIDIANDLSKNILNRVLNHRGERSIRHIVDIYTNKSVDLTDQRIKEAAKFGALDALFYFMRVSLTAYIIYHVDAKLTPVVYMSVDKVCESSWRIMAKMRSISEKSSGWGSLEKCLKTYRAYTKANNPLTIDIPMSGDEIQLCGESGCGKTTLMREAVIRAFVDSFPKQFIYMEQRMCLVKTNQSIQSFMYDDLNNYPESPKILLRYAQMLKIDNIINVHTLNKQFIRPSGGEEKRIMILRTLMPVILGEQVKVVFNDEITAGLDYECWLCVRALVGEIKQRGVKFITIDHHPIPVEQFKV